MGGVAIPSRSGILALFAVAYSRSKIATFVVFCRSEENFQKMYLMMKESSSYNGMAMTTLVADIQTIKNSFFVKMLFLLTKMLTIVVILTKNEFLMTCMSATNVPMTVPS